MAKDCTKRAPSFKPDKSFTSMEEFTRIDDHWRLKLLHSACYQGLRARAGDHLPRKTTRFADFVERHHRTPKAGYPSGRLKYLAERSAILGATRTVTMRYEEAKAGVGGSN
ncbi:MAG: hypothetical protein AVDCRST_MAG93-8506 [uncultured Chloroflexia bacterium]|uniref:Uncharacterized protein n=1 Tax=uncultured Chloroflexia bacterium TaxID=1672391 RepID=A0A6J4N139_9CHLR|nr:MAG: hypothetical protein AVDCRST_MAG93-8506 [uncultured Chloroflexia bacterium]